MLPDVCRYRYREGELQQKEFVYCRAGRRSNTRHHPPQGRSRYASFVQIRWSLFLVNCQKKNRGRCCVCRKEVCGLLGVFFTLKTVLLRKYVCASDKIFFDQILTFHSVRCRLDLSYTLTLSLILFPVSLSKYLWKVELSYWCKYSFKFRVIVFGHYNQCNVSNESANELYLRYIRGETNGCCILYKFTLGGI